MSEEKIHDVWVFGDSHWRVYFPFINHGPATTTVYHTQDNVRTIDTTSNELSGATMYGLLNHDDYDGNRARKRIIETIDREGGIDNIGLVFGEVDCRFHRDRYFTEDGRISPARVWETACRYRRFIDEDLLFTKRVRGNVFIYFGFMYPKQNETPTFSPEHHLGEEPLAKAEMMLDAMGSAINKIVIDDVRVHGLVRRGLPEAYVSEDGVHLVPELIYPSVLNMMRNVFDYQDRIASREIGF